MATEALHIRNIIISRSLSFNMPSSKRVSNIETKLIYLFGKEETKIDLIIGKKYAELFGELPNQNRNIIKDCKMKKKLISLFGVVRKPVKIIKKKKIQKT